MNKIIFALIMAAAPVTFAETLHCSFTEPFFSLDYNTQTQTLARTEPNDDGNLVTSVVARHVRVVPLKAVKTSPLSSYARYALIDSKAKVQLRLTLNYQGSDGMSDIVFPYDANIPGARGANNGVGGCESTTLKAINPDQN